ncbi:hypothetical protein ABK040_009523 [Willaertia magna]
MSRTTNFATKNEIRSKSKKKWKEENHGKKRVKERSAMSKQKSNQFWGIEDFVTPPIFGIRRKIRKI